jgi:hypothetical protein
MPLVMWCVWRGRGCTDKSPPLVHWQRTSPWGPSAAENAAADLVQWAMENDEVRCTFHFGMRLPYPIFQHSSTRNQSTNMLLLLPVENRPCFSRIHRCQVLIVEMFTVFSCNGGNVSYFFWTRRALFGHVCIACFLVRDLQAGWFCLSLH